MKPRTDVLPAEQVYAILANERRRRALQQLKGVGGTGTVHERARGPTDATLSGA